MAEVRWTTEQEQAINARGSTLLVSAAAGSGKTAVLVERLLRRIVSEKLDVTQFLIITFTKAAASELRRKISDALAKYAAEHPGDRHIRRQMALVGAARISTVHSFCSWLLKSCSNSEELSGGFRVLDESEGKIILTEELSELIDEKYNEKSEGFLALANYLSGARRDKFLATTVYELFIKSESHPYPERWLAGVESSYDVGGALSICETVWGEYAFEKAREELSRILRTYELMLEDVSQNAEGAALYSELLSAEKASLAACESDDWDVLREGLLAFSFGRLPSSKKLADSRMAERIKDMRSAAKKDLAGICEKLLSESSETLLSELLSLSPYMKELCSLVRELRGRFGREKLRRGAVDYSDLEHMAIKLLVEDYDEETDTVCPSEAAREVSKQFCEILLDEFQDSNCIQDIIFRAVSRDEKNLVMVGDVKQSIYRFRLADPSIFMKKYKAFGKFEDAADGEPRVITLSRNFRSRGEVLSASNALFSRIMSEKLGDVDYNDDQYLVEREDIPDREREDMKCEFHLIDCEEAEVDGTDAEARFIAEKICELVEGGFEISDKDGGRRPVTYRDFAILLRASAGNAEVYERVLSSYNIPYISPRAEGLLSKGEVQAIVSFLTVIDNPTADIQLIAVLRSPLFGFTSDDFCRIRRAGGGTIYSAMEALSKTEGKTAEKCRAFLSEASALRSLSRGMSAASLIWELYNRTNALGLFGAMSGGDERQRNLIEFFKYASAYENMGYFGLYKFISHIARLSERGGDIPAPATVTSDAVTIMTIHKSKGLEFPIVFLAKCIRSFNTEDIKASALVHPTYGVGLKVRNEEEGFECPTIARDVISRVLIDELKSEEVRVLYVAMTRAREKLFLVASTNRAAAMIKKTLAENAYPELDCDGFARRMGTQNWFMLPLLRSRAGAALFEYAGIPPQSTDELGGIEAYVTPPASEREMQGAAQEEALSGEEDVSEILRMLSFEYGHNHAVEAPSKVTATGVSHTGSPRTPRRKKPARPSFLRERSLTAAERGTALHMAMQFADFSRCTDEDGAASEITRLRSERFLTQAQADAVSPSRICAFVNSSVGREMRAAKSLSREYKFSVLLPADEMLRRPELAGEEVLLQGVMDMFFEDGNGEVTIVDFKTDRRRPEGEVLEKYSAQLRIYSRALFEMTGKRARRLVLYLVSLDTFIEV